MLYDNNSECLHQQNLCSSSLNELDLFETSSLINVIKNKKQLILKTWFIKIIGKTTNKAKQKLRKAECLKLI